MYVCLCNALKCRDVAAATDAGARDISSVFKACGAKPNCGGCFEEIERRLPTEADVASEGCDADVQAA